MPYHKISWEEEKQRIKLEIDSLTERESEVYVMAYSGLMKSLQDWGMLAMMEVPFRGPEEIWLVEDYD
jgi:hypothetical protein